MELMADYSKNNQALPDKTPPQNIEAEKSLLGSLMIDRNAIIKVVDFLQPRDFYKNQHQTIYESIHDLFDRNQVIDLLSLSSRLQEKGRLESIGGKAYLTELINSVPNAMHVLDYAKIVQKKRILRDLIQTSYEIGSMGFNEEEDVDILLDRAESQIFNIAQRSMSQQFIPIKNELEGAFERIDNLSKNKGAPRGIPTGFVDLDKILSGLQKSDLVILAARPSIGKSGLALDIARHIGVNEKKPVGVFSLEMSKDQVIDRFIASQSNVDLWKLRTGHLSGDGPDNDFERIQHALGVLSEAPIFIDDTAGLNILQMRAMARRLQVQHGLSLLVVDYLQLMEPRSANMQMVQQMTEISRSLKGLAKELQVPVLALSQLSRAVEQRTPSIPKLSDLRETGALEQDADVVLFIYREDKYRQDTARKNIADILIAKHRNGPVGKAELYFDEARASFRNLEKREFEDPGNIELEDILP
jgi:replicative DNA helicase